MMKPANAVAARAVSANKRIVLTSSYMRLLREFFADALIQLAHAGAPLLDQTMERLRAAHPRAPARKRCCRPHGRPHAPGLAQPARALRVLLPGAFLRLPRPRMA